MVEGLEVGLPLAIVGSSMWTPAAKKRNKKSEDEGLDHLLLLQTIRVKKEALIGINFMLGTCRQQKSNLHKK